MTEVDRNDSPKIDTIKKCAACGLIAADGLLTKFAAKFIKDGTWHDDEGRADVSFIQRTCPRCGYQWQEKPLYHLCQDT